MTRNFLFAFLFLAIVAFSQFTMANKYLLHSELKDIQCASVKNNDENLASLSSNRTRLIVELGEQTIIELVKIYKGVYSPKKTDCAKDSKSESLPGQKIKISKDFFLGKFEITQAQFKEVMGFNPSYFVYENSNNHPVEHVCWYDAVRFCNALSLKLRLTPCYRNQYGSTEIEDADEIHCNWSANGFRLPTEAEWEYACRAGTQTSFQSGEKFDAEYGWFWDNSHVNYSPNSKGRGTHAVGKKKENAWGLHDMHGSLWELCWDWYSPDIATQALLVDPKGPNSGCCRTYRGGCWSSRAEALKCFSRHGCCPLYRNGHMGFRICKNTITKSGAKP
jgi:formylglycine-generating enzyme required for sulfatase activity